MITVLPYIPEQITVHLGAPSSNAPNVTVPFPEYIKNVASSEIYPTWEPAALRSNILAIISYALNRVYTEYYRSRGYDFDITNSTAYDQKFVNGRNFFDSISSIVDEVFNSYLRRTGFVEPLAASFCNGTTSTCDGLSQWGSQNLALEGYNSVEILRAYYGNDVEIVSEAAIRPIVPSYPGNPLRLGDSGEYVVVIQVSLNRIAQNYPAIPIINPVDGIFSQDTEASVRKFQEIFSLEIDGIVGNATWYKLVFLYVSVSRLNELQSKGQTYYTLSWEAPETLSVGSQGLSVEQLQYMLAVVSFFVNTVPVSAITGTYSNETAHSVEAYQDYEGLPITGITDPVTWNAIYNTFSGIRETVLQQPSLQPPADPLLPARTISQLQRQLQSVASMYPNLLSPTVTGRFDRRTQQALMQAQSALGFARTGRAEPTFKAALAQMASEQPYSRTSLFGQYPGYPLSVGMQDTQ